MGGTVSSRLNVNTIQTQSASITQQFIKHCRLVTIYSLLWHHWLGVRNSIRPVKNWLMGCWSGYQSDAMCKWFAYGPADATATPSSLAPAKSRMVCTILVPAYPGCLGKEATKRVFVCVTIRRSSMTDRRHLVVTEVVAEHQFIYDGKHFLVVEEV